MLEVTTMIKKEVEQSKGVGKVPRPNHLTLLNQKWEPNHSK